MLPRLNIELLITVSGAVLAAAGVVLIAWTLRRAAAGRLRRYQRPTRLIIGLLLIIVGMYAAMKKYIDDSGWAQWIESMMGWLLPTICSTILAFGIAILGWAMLADRSRGRRRCPKCWYDMAGAAGLTCPECGKNARTPRRLLRTRRDWRLAMLALLLMVAGSIQFAVPWYTRGGFLPWIPTRVLISMLPSLPTLHQRAIFELDDRLAAPRAPGSRLQLRALMPLSDSTRHALSRQAVRTLTDDPKHPSRAVLIELMPEYLVAGDVPRAEPLLLAALNDPNSWVPLGAVTTLRRVDGFNVSKCVPAVSALVSPRVAMPGMFNEESLLSEAVKFLGERAAKDLGTVPTLVSLLKPGASRLMEWPTLHDEVLWTLSRMGPDASGAATTVASMLSRSPASDFDALLFYTLQLIKKPPASRRDTLTKMLTRPEEAYRAFAVAELGRELPDAALQTTLTAHMRDASIVVRLCAASLLVTRDTPFAGVQLDRDLADASDFMALEQVVSVLARHKVSLEPIESRVRAMYDAATGTRKNRLRQTLDTIRVYQTNPW